MNLHVVCIGSYQIREPEICDCFIFLVIAEDKIKAQVQGRRMCEERYSYLKGWDESAGLDVITLDRGMQVGQYVINYSIVENAVGLIDKDINHVFPSVYAIGVSSHYWWGQDEYPESLSSLVVAKDTLEARKFGEKTKDKLLAMSDGKWSDSYAIVALRLEDVTQVENHHIQWLTQKMEN